MNEQTKFDKIQKSFFDDEALKRLSPKDIEIRTRYQNVFSVWLENPWWSDKEMVRYIRQEFGVAKTQAYQDIQKVKLILGNVNNAAKEWQRYSVIEMIKEAYNLAKKHGDVKAMVMALDKLGKYTRLDQKEVDEIPWDLIVPPEFENTDDVTVLQIHRSADFQEKVKKIRRKYLGDIEEANVIEE